MSASERLRELAERQRLEGRFPQLPDYEGDIYLAALPLIADLAEAIERMAEVSSVTWMYGVDAALTALQEALNGSDGDGGDE